MKIRPTLEDYAKWIGNVPAEADLVFLSKESAELLKANSFSVYSRDEMKNHKETFWGLNSCTWYCYALSRSEYWAVLPAGTLESLDSTIGVKLAEEQIAYGVPTVLTIALPGELNGKLLELPLGKWITSAAWSQLSKHEQILTIQQWSIQNEINEYESIEFDFLPSKVKEELNRIGLGSLLNQFQTASGPNCFATVAGATATENHQSHYAQWLHWPQLEEHLSKHNYKIVNSDIPKVGDVLVFRENETPIHASYYIGEGLYIEKPGQDFFEPYRVQNFEKWQEDWPLATICLWRKRPGK